MDTVGSRVLIQLIALPVNHRLRGIIVAYGLFMCIYILFYQLHTITVTVIKPEINLLYLMPYIVHQLVFSCDVIS